MLDKFTHTNSANETLDFNALGIYANYNDLRDFEWSVQTYNERITGFYKGIEEKTIPFTFVVDKEKAAEIKNKFYEHFEKDVASLKKGFFEINGYKYYCYITKSAKANYLINKKILNLSIKTKSDKPYWIKETTKTVNFAQQEQSSDALVYSFTYPFIYRGGNSVNFTNDNFTSSELLIRIFGPAENPLVVINDNIHQVNAAIDSTEYLEISTEEKTIYKYSKFGDKTNLFNYRNKSYNIFKPMPAGPVSITANGDFKIELVMIEKRGEPKWI